MLTHVDTVISGLQFRCVMVSVQVLFKVKLQRWRGTRPGWLTRASRRWAADSGNKDRPTTSMPRARSAATASAAGITDRVGHSHQIPGAANMHYGNATIPFPP